MAGCYFLNTFILSFFVICIGIINFVLSSYYFVLFLLSVYSLFFSLCLIFYEFYFILCILIYLSYSEYSYITYLLILCITFYVLIINNTHSMPCIYFYWFLVRILFQESASLNFKLYNKHLISYFLPSILRMRKREEDRKKKKKKLLHKQLP